MNKGSSGTWSNPQHTARGSLVSLQGTVHKAWGRSHACAAVTAHAVTRWCWLPPAGQGRAAGDSLKLLAAQGALSTVATPPITADLTGTPHPSSASVFTKSCISNGGLAHSQLATRAYRNTEVPFNLSNTNRYYVKYFIEFLRSSSYTPCSQSKVRFVQD